VRHLLDRERSGSYDCATYAAEMWEHLTGDDIRPVLLMLSGAAYFRRVSKPAEPSLVVMRRGHAATHVGIFVRGRVQHLGRRGPVRQPLHLATLGYKSVRFYAPR
jgi:hypothetical protein